MQTKSKRSTKHIRINDDVYRHARVAAVLAQQGVGEWVEEAIISRLRQEPANLMGADPLKHSTTKRR